MTLLDLRALPPLNDQMLKVILSVVNYKSQQQYKQNGM